MGGLVVVVGGGGWEREQKSHKSLVKLRGSKSARVTGTLTLHPVNFQYNLELSRYF